MRRAVILAAGLSTRLRPLTDALPKPMLQVQGRPMLEYVVRQLAEYGVEEIVITTHYKPSAIVDYFGTGAAHRVKIRCAFEADLVETAGSLKRIEHLLEDDFLVVGGNDFLPQLDLGALYSFHADKRGIGTIVFHRISEAPFIGLFDQGVLSETQQLVSFHTTSKPPLLVSPLIHTTYQIYSPRIFSYIPADVLFSIPKDLIPALLENGERIFGYVAPGPFVCISTPALYQHAQNQMARLDRTIKKDTQAA